MRRSAPPVPRRWWLLVCLTLLLAWVSAPSAQQSPRPIADPNVNMVRGITFPDGDPYLQRQNEPSIAISTRNPCHLLAGANDYRSVDIPFDDTPLPPNGEPNISLAGDAWLGLFKSFDCGQKWQSTLLPGYPQDNSGQALTLKGYEAGADPTVRAGSNGLFYYSGMVFNRGADGNSQIFVARFVDNNNKERGDPIEYLDVATIDTGTKGQFLDKPWLAVDIPRNSFGPGSTLANGSSASGTCTVNGQQIPAGNVYMAYARFTGNSDQHSKLMFARSTDCGKTWKTNPISNNQTLSQGANIAVAPHDGTIYLTWREFAGNNKPVNMWVAVSSDGGQNFSNPKMIAGNVQTFDQIKSTTRFRSNALPAITADHQDRVYIAWAERGYAATCTTAAGDVKATDDARIVMTVSSDRGQTFATRFPIDPSPQCGHQMMPSLAFAAGKVTGIYYDAREDQSGVFTDYVDDKDIQKGSVRHTIDVRAVQADPSPQPVFVPAGADSLEVSKYRTWTYEVKNPDGTVTRKSSEVGSNPPNLAMYAAATMPFMGDYIDLSGLSSFPIQTGTGQVWQPNIGPINLMGASASSLLSNGFPTLPIFHAVWTDNRDVRSVSGMCAVPPDPSTTGERNANIYTSRLTPGLFVGSPGNTKPLGFRTDPVSGKPTDQLIQRGFVVFAQNTTAMLKFYELHITNQPVGGKASFRQFEKPGQEPLTTMIVSIPKGSTLARTVYATSTDPVAQILVNVQEVTPTPPPPAPNYEWVPPAGGLRGSVLLNPDRTNPKILDPDLDSEVPQIATSEVHNPSMFDAQFFYHKKGTGSRQLDVKNPDPENPDPENPDPENPDPENPDPENPDPENPDPENPDPENPDPENPDPENPDPENLAVRNEAIGDEYLDTGSITDINWRVHNSGNTTSAYKFRPSIAVKKPNEKYQLIVTRRYMTLAMSAVLDPITGQFVCKPVYKSQNQVVVNIENFQPRTPDPENPDPENPDPENPDPENPDPENPDPENPDPENPDPENANFFLAPDETATVTLRVFTPEGDEPPSHETSEKVAAKTAAQAANTGETKVSTAVTGPDLTLSEPGPTFGVPGVPSNVVRPGATVNVNWTLTNRGTAGAVSPSGTIKNNVYFSNDPFLDRFDTKIGATVTTPASAAVPFPHCAAGDPETVCRREFMTPVVMPGVPGQYYVIVTTDADNDADEYDEDDNPLPENDDEVFEADEFNNIVVLPIKVDAYQLSFLTQPSSTTQDFTMTPPVVVAITHPDGQAVGLGDVPAVTLAIQNNPAPGGILSGTTVQPNAGGVATFADLKIDRAASGYTLAATAPFSTGAISAPFNIEADLPPVVANDSYTVQEDTPLDAAAPGVLTNDSDPATKGLAPEGYGLRAEVATGPASGTLELAGDGSFTYQPNAGFSGADGFTYRALDGRAGNETTGTVTITVTSINDVPSFTAGANQTVPEDSGPQTVPNWAAEISAGANEPGQAVDFIVTNDNNALFSVQPAVSPNGTLTYAPAANTEGVATVTVRIHDNGGTANGGVDTSAPQSFTITVTGVPDAPVPAADSYATNEDAPLAIAAPGVLANDSDADAGTTLTAAVVTTASNGVLVLNANGSFTYTPNAHFFGADSFTYRANDGALNSDIVTVSLTVSSVNDAPSFTKGADQTAPSGNVAQTVPGWATAISAGPANESAQVIDFIVSNDNTAIFSVQPAISPAGTLTFTPKQNQPGAATVTVRAHDNGGTANGGLDTSAPQMFTITVTNAIQNFVVTNTNDSGNGSLRAAITNANANGSADVISFDIAGGGLRTITPLSPLPAIVFPVVINATTQTGYNGAPLVELNGSSAGAGANGLTINTTGVTIRGLIVNRFAAAGISVVGANHVITGNYIGTNAAGTQAQGNGTGILVSGPSSAVIGGDTPGLGNVISGNTGFGIHVTGSLAAPATLVQGNLIGLDASGANALGNAGAGIKVTNSAVEIGGAVPGARNVISANPQGVAFSNSGSTFNSLIAGNYFGTDVTGMVARGNTTGVLIASAPGTRVGGDAPGAGNRFAGNSIGVTIDTISHPVIDGLYNAIVQGNIFGLNAAGAALPNGRGIAISNSDNLIGGTTPGAANVIANSTLTGVDVAPAGARNRITGNSIYDNGALGIDLGNDGLTPNDAGDADAGANNLQNFPVLTTAFSNGVGTTVAGTLNSTANTALTIELFSNTAADPSGYGEGRLYLGAINAATDAAGNAAFGTGLPNIPPGQFLTAIAIDPAGNTSEFSLARLVVANNAPTATNDDATAIGTTATTIYPSANDTDPDITAPSIVATLRAHPVNTPNLVAPGEVAVVSATGLGYFSALNFIGILDTATQTVVGAIPLPVSSFNATGPKVNQATRIVYFRLGNTLVAVDGRPESPTFNQVILSTTLGSIQGLALDEINHRLYVAHTTSGSGTIAQSRVSVLDIQPLDANMDPNPGFHQFLDHVTVMPPEVTTAIDVNPATNMAYVATGSHVYSLNGSTLALVQLPVSGAAIAVNELSNLIYASSGSFVRAIDGTTGTVIATITMPATVTGSTQGRLAIHKASGRVFVRLSEFPAVGRLVVIDGDRNSPTFNTILATLPIGRESGNTAMAVDQVAGRVITTSPIDHKSTVIDTATMTEIGPIPAPGGTLAIGLHPAAGRAYVVSANGLQVINLANGTLVTSLQTGIEVDYLVVDTNAHKAYVPRTGYSTDIQVVAADGQAALIEPNSEGFYFGRAFNATTNRVYVANFGSTVGGGSDALPGFVAVIDGATGAVLDKVTAGNRPQQVAVNEATNKIYVANAALGLGFPGGITVIDGVTHAVMNADLRQLPVTSATANVSAGRVTVNPATGKVYFLINGSTATLGVLDGNTNVATALPAVVGSVFLIRVNPVLNRVYVIAQVTGQPAQLYVLNGATDQVLATMPVGSRSLVVGSGQSYLAVNRTTGQVFVADYDLNTLTVIDGATNAIVKTLAVGRGPTSVAIDETANRIYVGNALDRTVMFVNGALLKVESTLAVPMMPVWLEVDPVVKRVFANGGCISGNARCPWFDTGVMVIADPGNQASQLTTTSVTQGANGSVTINADGSVSYTANVGFSGNDSFTYTASDGLGGASAGTVNVTVTPALTITTAALPPSTVGTSYTESLAATGGTAPLAWSVTAGVLPGGVTLTSNTGAISGTVRQAGTFTFTVQVRDAATPAQVAIQTYSLVVGPPFISTTGLPSGFIATPYSQTLVAGGTTGAVTWALNTNNQPALSWLSLSSDGVLSGTPSDPGQTPSFTVTATDAGNQSASRSYSLNIGAPLDVFPLREGVVLESQSAFAFTGGNGNRTVTRTDGNLPPGLILLPGGSFTGTPTRHGEYGFTVEIRDCEPNSTTGLPTCNNQTIQQVVTRDITLRVSAKEQQGSSGFGGSVAFGGSGGRRLAQVFTVGAQGTLTAIGLNNVFCPSVTPVTVEIQRLALNGLPDGNTISDGVAVANYNAIVVTPALPVTIDERYAFIVSSPVACTGFNNSSTSDAYNGGDAYADAGGGWLPLFSTDARYDLPSFRTLIQPAMEVTYLNRGRGGLTQTLLGDGKVLLVGNTTAAEIYDPATRTSTLISNPMALSRTNHTATLLEDGTVLIVGGRNQATNFRTNVVEIFDPVTGLVTTAAAQLGIARDQHRAVRLNDGRVLIVGGFTDFFGRTASSEIYDPVTQTFSPSGNMSTGREQFTATLLVSGKVLVTGGYTNGGGSHAEVFDPATGMFTATGNMEVSNRGQSTATLLADGTVLIAGGQAGDVRSEAEIYDPATNSFAATGSMMSSRIAHTATLLADGSVLIAGGYDQQNNANYILALATLERYVPGSGTFVAAGSMVTRRQSFAALRLPDDTVFLSGGFSQSWMTGNTGELYDPAAALTITPTTLPDGQPNVEYAGVVLTASGGGGPPYLITQVSGLLPPGMIFVQASATLSGTPTASGVFPLGFEATDNDGNIVVQTLILRVGNINTITSPYRLPDAAITAYYEVPLSATGAPPVVWSLAPASSILPPGLALGSAGVITGTPAATGYYNFTVRALDATGQTAMKVLSINVSQPLNITTTSLSDGTAGNTYGGCVSTSGGVGTRTWSLSGDIPLGMAIQSSNGCFDGAWPARALRQGGTFTFTVHVTDSSAPPQSDAQSFTIRVHAQDQQPSMDFSQPPIPVPATRRIAQVFRASSPFPLSGLQLQNSLTCSTATQFVVEVRPVTGSPARPDESGAPLGAATVTTSANGFFNSQLAFPQSIAIPQGSLFAVVVSFADQCSGTGWPATDWYRAGDAWIDDGGGWTLASAEIGRYDIPFMTLVMPPGDLRFFSGWNGGAASATLDGGRLLIVGTEQWAEVFDPDANTLVNSANNMASRRQQATATTLTDGKVLVVGGNYWDNNQQVATNTTSIFDPATNTFSAGPVMPVGRWGHRATRLGNGKVLITGGWTRDGNNQITLDSALLFADDGMSFVPLTMTGARVRHSATLISGDRVLVVGGWTGTPWPSTVAEIYDPAVGPDGTFTAVPGGYNRWPAQHTATLITAGARAGQVLIAGGAVGNYPNLDAAGTFFDPVTLTFSAGPDLLVPRFEHTATTLNDGTIIFAGGVSDWFNYRSTTVVEMYDPVSDQATVVGDLITDRNEHTAAIVTGVSGTALAVAGGWGSASLAPKTIELVDLTAAALTITTTTLPDGMTGQNYVAPPIGAAGGSGGYTFTLAFGALPPGLALAADGTLSGEPSTSGIYNFVVQVADSSNVATRSLTIVVNRLVITSASPLPSVVTNGNYSHQLTVAGGVGTVTWSIDCCSQPPAGITMDADGLLSGTAPPAAGNYFFWVRATDAAGQVAIKGLSLQVVTPLMITTTTLGDGTAGETYFGCMGWNGGSGAFTWSLSGQYPIGLSIQNNGCFDNNYPAGVLRQGGTYNFTVHVSDSSFPPQSDTQDFTIRVHAQDQNPGWGFGDADVPMPATRRIAQVYRSSSAFPLSGLQVFGNLTCDPGVQVTAAVWPVTGSPAAPDESDSPLGSATATTNEFGWFNSMVVFANPIAMPQGALFAVTLDADGACSVKNWPVDHFYRGGDAWVDDNGTWTLARTAVGREDLPFSTLVLPASGLRFFSSWRGGQATATLADGRLLLVGPDHTAEIYDPATNTLTNTAGNMSTGRHGATATLLTDGKVLVAGGQTWNGNQNVANNTTEIFNPVTGMFSPGPVMTDGRYNHAATTLADGRVLITGGTSIVTIEGNTFWLSINSAVLFDGTGAIQAELAMTGARAEHSATLLDDERVLIIGGWTSDPWPATVAEIFDPDGNTFTGVAAGLPTWPSQHTATLLTTGKVLIAGGPGNYPALSTDSFLFDPLLESFTNGPGLAVPRMQHTATPLADGRVVFTGGIADWQYNVATSAVEFYDPLTNQFTPAGDLVTDRFGHAVDLVTVAGQPMLAVSAGWGSGALASKTIELFDVAAAQTALVITTPTLPDGQTGVNYGAPLAFAGGSGDYILSLAWGTLPAGLLIDAQDGDVYGTPTMSGIFTFTLRVTDSSSQSAYRTFTIVIDRLTITSPQTLPEAVTGVAYSYQFTRSGGTGPFTWSSPSLPGGLSLTPAGLLFGTLNTTGWVGGTITVTDAAGQTALTNFNILVMAPLTLAAGTPFLGVATEFYHYEVQPQNGIYPLTWSIDSGLLLPGLQLDQFGSINGFPTRTGRFDVTVRATDSTAPSQTATQNVLERVTAIDQSAPGGPLGNTVSIHSTQSLAQTVTVRANAPIYAIRAPVTCASGTLTITIKDVMPGGEPGASILASGTFAAPMPLDEKFLLGAPFHASAGWRLAVAFSSDGDCTMLQPSEPDNYGGGAAYVNTGGGWTPMPGYADFKLETLVDLPDLQFTPTYRPAPQLNLLGSGSVLITGGSDQVTSYDPVTRLLVDRPPSVLYRSEGTATLLPNGKVLLAGGQVGLGVTNGAELWDPATGTATATGEPMEFARKLHTATLLADGKVLIAGGLQPDGVTFVPIAEIYDPGTDTFSQAGTMVSVRILHQATLLPSNKVLITGGASSGNYEDAELYEPGTGFVAVANPMNVRRLKHRDVRLLDGRVLVTGGQNFDAYETVAAMELYDENCDCFTEVAPLGTVRQLHSATLVANGNVLVAGGVTVPDSNLAEATMEVFDPLSGIVKPAGSMDVARAGHAAIRLCPQGGCGYAGQVLFAGGFIQNAAEHSVETFDPAVDVLPVAIFGSAYGGSIASTFLSPTFMVVTGALPSGLSVNATTGDIEGSPTQLGTFSFTVRITDGPTEVEYKTLALVVEE